MKPINPNFLMAKRRAELDEQRFGHPHLNYPAIARKGKPVPTELEPLPEFQEAAKAPPIPGWNWDTAIVGTCAAIGVSLFFIGV